ncbi:MAG: hypothetical protein LUO79_01030 [Methanomassiliicoccales archaeon]|nr:hypothetical protein [Methanomassiliicoccales archaeon]
MRPLRRDRSNVAPKAVSSLKCEACGWEGGGNDLVEKEEAVPEVMQQGYYSIGQPMKTSVYHRLECPKCGMKLGEVALSNGVETGRIDISSSEANDVACPNCGWKGKDVQLTRFSGELDASDALYRFTYREGIGQVKFLCPKCRALVDKKVELYGRGIG